MKQYEIELRYEVLNSASIEAFVMPFQQISVKRDIDIYFDNAALELYQKGIFIRVRNNTTLDIKFNRACLEDPTLPLQAYCEEHIFALPLTEADVSRLNDLLQSLALSPLSHAHFENLLTHNHLQEHYRVDKKRTTYTHDGFTIALDEVAGLGSFLEMETLVQTLDEIEVIKGKMHELLMGLELKPFKSGYGAMLLKKKNIREYLLGRFIAPEDKITLRS